LDVLESGVGISISPLITAYRINDQENNLNALIDSPLVPGFLDGIGTMVGAMAPMAGSAGAGGINYSFSKRGVLRQVARKAALWGKGGARIVSISPGLILTPMGRKKLAETPGAQLVNEAAPTERSRTAMDIALVAQLLASDAASFITGCDLRVDGVNVAAMRTA
jgi:NAD(P)-dependent dehydrogenase (short-subunit alcohol dehydrogenase family)